MKKFEINYVYDHFPGQVFTCTPTLEIAVDGMPSILLTFSQKERGPETAATYKYFYAFF